MVEEKIVVLLSMEATQDILDVLEERELRTKDNYQSVLETNNPNKEQYQRIAERARKTHWEFCKAVNTGIGR